MEDFFTIGDCTIYLGNCLAEKMPTCDHLITDPPYEEQMHKSKKGLRGLRNDGGKELSGLNFTSIDEIRDEFINQVPEICAKWLIVFCSPEGVGRWAAPITASPMKYKRACVWVKPDSAPQFNGQCPAMGAEMFVTAWAGKGFSKWNGGGKRNIWTFPTNPTDRDGRHPTEKPWRLMAAILNDFTNRGDVILDPFMGSGSTGVACIKQGRKFIGFEKDKAYFEIAKERLIKAHAQTDLFLPQDKPVVMTQGVMV